MKRSDFLQLYFSLTVWFLINMPTSFQISCKDEENQDVDWFIIYKLPTIEKEKKGTYLHAGKGYAYLKSKGTNNWALSSNSIESEESILAKTWQNFKDTSNKGSDVAYLFYNDQPPKRHKGGAVGHLKGYFAFDSESGIWLIHSIPRYGNFEEHKYPASGLKNGQVALCVTFSTTALNEICRHLLYCHPNIYDSKISNELRQRLDKIARSIFTSQPDFRRTGFLARETLLKSKNNENFIAFAKDNQLKIDIYSELLTTYLRTSLLVESWSLGRGALSLKVPKPEYSVTDITSINMTVRNREGGIAFRSREDHSKWAISTDGSSKWVCIADLNHMKSQKKRGGGAVCFHSKPVWKAFHGIVKRVSQKKEF